MLLVRPCLRQLTGGTHGEVRVWELRSREMVAHLKEHTMAVTDMVSAMVTCARLVFRGHTSPAMLGAWPRRTQVLFDDDVHAVTCSRDKSFLCWDLRREKRISSHTQRMGGINAVCLSRDQSLVLTAGQEKRITYVLWPQGCGGDCLRAKRVGVVASAWQRPHLRGGMSVRHL